MDGVHIADQLVYSQFEEMAALEGQAYGEEFITPVAEAWEWYRCHPASVVAAIDDGSGAIAGFANLFPVRPALFNALAAGLFNDSDLTADQILDLPKPGEPLLTTMFLSCIVVEESYRGRGLARWLLGEAARTYEGCVDPGARIVTDNVTPQGERLSQRLGFELACVSHHGSHVYLRDYAGFVRVLTS